jgi:hypothetical protein
VGLEPVSNRRAAGVKTREIPERNNRRRKLQLSYLEAIDRGMLRSIWMRRLDPRIPKLERLAAKTSGATDGERAVASQKLADLKREIFAVPSKFERVAARLKPKRPGP